MEASLRLTARKQLLISLRHLLIRLLPILEYLARPNVCLVILPILILQPLYTDENDFSLPAPRPLFTTPTH